MVTGEFDPLAHLEHVVAVYGKVGGPKELRVVENNFHSPRHIENFGGLDFFGYLADWLRDVLAGRKSADLKRVAFVREKDGLGAYGGPTPGIFPPERLGNEAGTLTPTQLGPAGIRKL